MRNFARIQLKKQNSDDKMENPATIMLLFQFNLYICICIIIL